MDDHSPRHTTRGPADFAATSDNEPREDIEEAMDVDSRPPDRPRNGVPHPA